MNKIPYILVSILLFVGCNNSAQYTALEQVDSLIANNKVDSAYIILQSINADDLSAKDNAYYSLLFTTAQYKECLPIPNDSIINIAVEYYTNHFDQNKLACALMYKGGVLADLKYNKLALESYKGSEKIADTTDYLTMGLLNFRMGELYQKSYIKNDEHINRYKIALKYFRKAKHNIFENNTRAAIGQLYSTRNYDSADVYLNKALSVARELDNEQQIVNCSFILSKFYNYHNTNLVQAKNLALIVYQNKDSITVGSDLISHISILYCKLNVVDSARYFANQFTNPISSIDTMNYYMMGEELALNELNYKKAYESYKKSEKIADSLVRDRKSKEYYAIDKEFDNQIILVQKEKLEYENNLQKFIIIIFILGLFTLTTLWYLYSTRKKRILNEKEQFIDNLQNSLQHVLDTNIKELNQNKNNETVIKKIIENRISMIKKLLNIKYQFGSQPDIFFNKFNEIIALNQRSRDDCDEIISMANKANSNIIDGIENANPTLNYKEKLLLSLVSLQFSPVEMLVFLNLNNLGSVYNIRSRLLKKLDTNSLENYINKKLSNINV